MQKRTDSGAGVYVSNVFFISVFVPPRTTGVRLYSELGAFCKTLQKLILPIFRVPYVNTTTAATNRV